MKYRTTNVILFLLLACFTVFGQTSYKTLTPGKSTKADVQRVLGPAVNAANPLLVEYRPQPLTGKIYVQYRKGAPVVERIEFLCRLANSTCNDLLNRLKLRLPENQETAKITEGGGKNKQVLYYGTPLYLVVSVDDESLVNNEVMPYRVAFFSRELYAASAAEVKEANEAAVLKAEEDRKELERAGVAPGLSAVITRSDEERNKSIEPTTVENYQPSAASNSIA